jgi:hypothetical protein
MAGIHDCKALIRFGLLNGFGANRSYVMIDLDEILN